MYILVQVLDSGLTIECAFWYKHVDSGLTIECAFWYNYMDKNGLSNICRTRGKTQELVVRWVEAYK